MIEELASENGWDIETKESNWTMSATITTKSGENVAYYSISKVNHSLTELVVSPKFQGFGVAGTIVEAVKEIGVDNLLAEAYRDGLSQEALVKFYEKHGFTVYASNGKSSAMELA